MNLIQLLFSLKLEEENFCNYTEADIIKLNKKLKVEQQINSKIAASTINSLLAIIKTNPKELQELLQKKNLVAFLLEERVRYRVAENAGYSHPDFTVFFNNYLEKDFTHLVQRKIAAQDFETLNKVMVYRNFLSNDFTSIIQETLEAKLMSAYLYYSKEKFSMNREYRFLINRHFFIFLNNFNCVAIENYVIEIYIFVTNTVNTKNKEKHPLYALKAFSYFITEQKEFQETLIDNNKLADSILARINQGIYDVNDSSNGSWRSILLIVFVIIKIILLIVR